MARPTRHRRTLLNFRGAQTSDVTTGDNAGGNITHNQGAELSEVVELVHAIFLDDTRREHRQAVVDRRFDRLESFIIGLLIVVVVLALLVVLLIVVVLDRSNAAGLARTAYDLTLGWRRWW